MAHEITSTDKYAEVRTGSLMIDGKAVARSRAWHGLGLEAEDGQSCEEFARWLGIDWGTEIYPCYAEINGQQVRVPGTNAQVRVDNGEVLGTVSDDYQKFENMDLARLGDSLVGADAAVRVETGGTLVGGRRCFFLIRLPQTVEAARDDVLHQYICLSTGHAGFAATHGYPTAVRVVCANTLRWSERDLARGFKLRHTGNFEDKVKMARNVLGLAVKETAAFKEQVEALVHTKMTKAETREWMRVVWADCFGQIDCLAEDEQAAMVAKRDALVETWLLNLEDKRQQITGIRGTAWAAYNAVSQWHDHERGRFSTIHESDARVHSNLFGISMEHKRRAYRSALALAR